MIIVVVFVVAKSYKSIKSGKWVYVCGIMAPKWAQNKIYGKLKYDFFCMNLHYHKGSKIP